MRLFLNPDSPFYSFGDAHRERKKSCSGHKNDAVWVAWNGRVLMFSGNWAPQHTGH